MTIKRIIVTACGIVAMIGLMASPVLAITYYFPLTGYEDDDIEFYIPSGSTSSATTGTLSIGDRLVGVAEFNTTFSILPPGSSTPIGPGEELTAVFDLTVSNKVCAAGVCVFTFSPTNQTGSEGFLTGQTAGTAVTLYLDNVDDLNLVSVNCTSLADCIDKANNGSVYLEGGFYGDPDAEWIAVASTDQIVAVFNALATTSLGNYNFCLQAGTNNTGFTLLPQSCILGGDTQITGSGNINGGQGLTNGAFGRSDNDFQIQPVPEPSTLLLLGAGLLGVNFISRRRTKNK